MPFIHVEIMEGLSMNKKQELVKEMTDTFTRVAGVPQDRIFIFFEELKKENYAKNGSLTCFIHQAESK